MSTTVEERVVSMQFDNKRFEGNAQNTINTLDRLKQSLKLQDASKGLDSVNNSIKSINMTNLTNSIEKVQLKFTALQAIAIGALTSIGRTIATVGTNLVTSLTITPIKTGLAEYETQLNAVQTILSNTANKGSTLNDVNSALDELNAYADKTIYNFSEMARNIGTFTAAGIDLDTSVAAIKGIANLAAVSGSTSQQASTAMYQLSQALATGTVKLMDWNSVVNAGMGGQVFQDALKETARVHGVAIDQIIEEQGSFRDSLSEGWLSAQILTDTLAKFTGDLSAEQLKSMGYTDEQVKGIVDLGTRASDAATKVKTFTQLLSTLRETAQSGWAQSFEIIIGDFESAKALWTEVNNTFGGFIDSMSDKRNKFLSDVFGSGMDKMLMAGIPSEKAFQDSLSAVAKGYGVSIKDMMKDGKTFEEALAEGIQNGVISTEMLQQSVFNLQSIMDHMTDQQLKSAGYTEKNVEQVTEMANKLRDGSLSMGEFTEALGKMSGRMLIIESIKNIFHGILGILKPIKEAFSEMFPAPKAYQMYSVLEKIYYATLKFRESIENNKALFDGLKNTFMGIFSVFKIVWEVTKVVTVGIVKLVGALFGLTGGVFEITGALGKYITKLHDVIKKSKIFEKIIDKISYVAGIVADKIKWLVSAVRGFFASTDFSPFINALKNVWEVVKLVGSHIWDSMVIIGKAIGEAFGIKNFQDVLDIINKALTTGVLAGLLKYLTKLNNKANETGSMPILEKFKEVLGGVRDCFVQFQESIKSNIILKIAVATLILASSLLMISSIDTEDILVSLGSLAVVMSILMKAFASSGSSLKGIREMVKSMGAWKSAIVTLADTARSSAMLMSLSFAVLALAGALYIIAKAIKEIASIEDTDKAWVGIAGMAAALAGISLVLMSMSYMMKRIPTAKKLSGIGTAMIKLAAAFAIFAAGVILIATAMKLMSSIDTTKMWQSALIIIGITGMFGAAIKIIPKSKYLVKFGWSMVLMGAALIAASAAMKILSTIKTSKLIPIAISLVTVIGMMGAIIQTVPKNGQFIKFGASMAVLAGSLVIVAAVCKIVSAMSWKDLGKGGAFIGGLSLILLGITAAMKLMPEKVSLVKFGASMVILAGSLITAAAACKIISSISWKNLGKGGAFVGGLSLILVGITAAMKLMPEKVSIIKFGASMAILAGSLLAATAALKIIATISWGDIGKCVVAMLGTLAIMTAAIWFLSGSDSTLKAGGSLAILSAGLLALSAAMISFNFVKWSSVGKGIVGLAGALAILTAATWIMKKLQITGTLLLVSSAVAIMGAGIVFLGAGLAAIASGALAFFSALKEIISGILTLIPEIVELILTFITSVIQSLATHTPEIIQGLCDIVYAVLFGLIEASNAEGENYIILLLTKLLDLILKFTDIIINEYTEPIVDKILAGLRKIIDTVTKNIPAITDSIAGLVEAIFVNMARSFNEIDMGAVLLGTKAIAMLIGMMAMLALGAGLAPLAVIGALAICTTLPMLLVAIEAASLIAGKADKLGVIGEGIGSFIGGLVKGFSGIAVESLPKIGECMSAFMVTAAPFFEALDGISAGLVAKAGLLALVITAMGVAATVAGVGMMTGLLALPTIGAAMSLFMYSADYFFKSLNNVPLDAIAKAAIIAGVIPAFAIASVVSAIATFLTLGNTSLPAIGAMMSAFMFSAKYFFESMNTVPLNAIAKAAIIAGVIPAFAIASLVSAIASLLSLGGTSLIATGLAMSGFMLSSAYFFESLNGVPMNAIAKAGLLSGVIILFGAAQIISAISQISSLGIGLVKMGTDLSAFMIAAIPFFSLLSTIPEETINSAKILAETLLIFSEAQLLEGISNFISFGEKKTLGNFGTELASFGKALRSFANEVEGIDAATVKPSADALLTLVEVAKKIPKSDGWLENIFGDDDIDKFGSKLKKFAEKLVDFASKMSGVSVDTIDHCAKVINSVRSLFSGGGSRAAGGRGGSSGRRTDTSALDSMTESLPKFGKAIKQFANHVNDIDAEKLSLTTGTITSAITEVSSIGTEMMTAFTSSINGSSGTIVSSISNLFQLMILNIKVQSVFVERELVLTCKNSLTTVKNYKTGFYNAGMDLVNGFANGITDNTWKAEARAAAMAAKALAAAKEALGVNSPSKEFYSVAEWCGVGFVNAFKDYESKSFDAGTSIGDSATSGLKKAVAKVKDMVENNIDGQPTIRPVLDLSNVESGMNSMNGMFNNQPALAFSTAGAFGTMQANRQNGTNADVISAINDLRDSLNNRGDSVTIGDISYSDGSEVSNAVRSLVKAIKREGRV